ncbi:MAG: hypothetical protein ACWGSQ_11825 [Longimicrobiales bacterium]
MRTGIAGLVLLVALFSASEADAQVPWESPLMVGPGSPGGLSVLIADPGAGIGAFVHWRGRGSGSRLGYRLGLAEEGRRDNNIAIFGGVDIAGRILDHSDEFPLDMVWVVGLGGGFGSDILLSFPFGVSLGRVITTEEVWFHPYLTPRLILDAFFGDSARDDLDLDFALDLGADFSFSPGWTFRFGASIGDRDGLAFGLALPVG